MRNIAAALAALAALLPAWPATATEDVCIRPRCIDISVPVTRGLNVPERRVRVVLPQDYSAEAPGYPVVYVLHGVGDTYETWTRNTDLIDFSGDLGLILVMPDGGRGSDAGWYSDWVDGSRDWESFHIGEVVDFIDRRFNTLGDGYRGIAGVSMGGFGAMSYAARHPGLFAAAASFSGVVDTRYLAPASGAAFAAFNERFGTPDERVWGDQLTNSQEWAAHNPTDRAADLGCVRLWISSGSGTPGGEAGEDPSDPAGYGVENAIFQMNLSFVRALTVAGVEHHRDFYAGGYHDWPYWQRVMRRALPWMSHQLTAARKDCRAVTGVTDN